MMKNAITATLLLAALLAASCGNKNKDAEAKSEEQPLILDQQDVASIQLESLNSGVLLTGSLQPAWIVSVKAQLPGTVATIRADRGTRVHAGQTLATIRAAGITGQAEGARAAVAAAQANLSLAEQRLESATTLRKAGAMSEIDFKAAAAGYEAARAQLAAARAAAAGAAESAGHANVRAPIAGVVGTRSIEAGEAVSSGDELFTVVRSDYLELSGQVGIEQANQIRPGQPVVFTLDAYPDRSFQGEVSRIEPMADVNTRQVGVYVRMRNPGALVGGQFASGRILTSTVADALVVPDAAIRGSDNDRYVFVVENGRAVKKSVHIGTSDLATGRVEIRSGLTAGQTVIVAPGAMITENARIQVGAQAPVPARKRER